ncbi:hypothetical protein [Phocaeicola massiliensis]|nr:hypothetical protein [Phocaeicola massiliensis]
MKFIFLMVNGDVKVCLLLVALTTVCWLLNQASGSFTHHLVG